MILLGYAAAALVTVLTLVATWFYHTVVVYKLSLDLLGRNGLWSLYVSIYILYILYNVI